MASFCTIFSRKFLNIMTRLPGTQCQPRACMYWMFLSSVGWLLPNVRLDLNSSQGTNNQSYCVPLSVMGILKKFNKIDTREGCWSSAWGNAESRRRNFRKFRIFLLRYFPRQKSSEVAKFLSPISKTLGRKQELKEGKN
jgi:hypothetical protein